MFVLKITTLGGGLILNGVTQRKVEDATEGRVHSFEVTGIDGKPSRFAPRYAGSSLWGHTKFGGRTTNTEGGIEQKHGEVQSRAG